MTKTYKKIIELNLLIKTKTENTKSLNSKPTSSGSLKLFLAGSSIATHKQFFFIIEVIYKH